MKVKYQKISIFIFEKHSCCSYPNTTNKWSRNRLVKLEWLFPTSFRCYI